MQIPPPPPPPLKAAKLPLCLLCKLAFWPSSFGAACQPCTLSFTDKLSVQIPAQLHYCGSLLEMNSTDDLPKADTCA